MYSDYFLELTWLLFCTKIDEDLSLGSEWYPIAPPQALATVVTKTTAFTGLERVLV